MPTAQVMPVTRPRIVTGPTTGAVSVALKGPGITTKIAETFGNLAAEKANTEYPVIRRIGGVYCYHFNGSSEDRTKWVAELMKLEEDGKLLPKDTMRVSADEIKFPEGGNAIRYNNN